MKNIYALLMLCFLVTGCRKKPDDQPLPARSFSNIVILGNSITQAGANKEIGWNGNWGMAASTAELDFVHLLTARFQSRTSNAVVSALNIAQFETDYANYNLDANLGQLKSLKPDLLIIRIGENVSQDNIDEVLFEKKYTDLIAYFKSANPNLKVLGVGSCWMNEPADRVMAKASDFITLKAMYNDLSNYAWGFYSNNAVASHPSDKGMKTIADLIWEKVLTLK